MAVTSSIEWTESTWNPVRGCTKVSPGCKHCYAELFAERFRGVPNHPYEDGFDLRLVPERLEEPLKWKRPRLIFVNSMSDLFHEAVPAEYVKKVFAVMKTAAWHTFQVLTKRSERLLTLGKTLHWPDNVWMGVSVERHDYLYRVQHLQMVPATVRFISAEPLLGPLPRIPLKGIHWVIVGGESGPKARPMDPEWVRGIRSQCQDKGVSLFLKQLGGRRHKRSGDEAVLDGRLWAEMPIIQEVTA